MKDTMKIKGILEITLWDKFGKIKEHEIINNLVVNVGKYHIANLLTTSSESAMSHMAIGTGSTAATVADTSLVSELDRKTFESKAQGTGTSANQVEFNGQWGTGEGVGAITEAAIFNASSGGVMLNRAVFSVKNKGNDDTLAIKWTLIVA